MRPISVYHHFTSLLLELLLEVRIRGLRVAFGERRGSESKGNLDFGLKIQGFCELHKPTLSLLFSAFSHSAADTFAECDMRSLEQLFVMDTS